MRRWCTRSKIIHPALRRATCAQGKIDIGGAMFPLAASDLVSCMSNVPTSRIIPMKIRISCQHLRAVAPGDEAGQHQPLGPFVLIQQSHTSNVCLSICAMTLDVRDLKKFSHLITRWLIRYASSPGRRHLPLTAINTFVKLALSRLVQNWIDVSVRYEARASPLTPCGDSEHVTSLFTHTVHTVQYLLLTTYSTVFGYF